MMQLLIKMIMIMIQESLMSAPVGVHRTLGGGEVSPFEKMMMTILMMTI